MRFMRVDSHSRNHIIEYFPARRTSKVRADLIVNVRRLVDHEHNSHIVFGNVHDDIRSNVRNATRGAGACSIRHHGEIGVRHYPQPPHPPPQHPPPARLGPVMQPPSPPTATGCDAPAAPWTENGEYSFTTSADEQDKHV